MCFLFRDIFTYYVIKRHATKRERERERERERDDHIFSNRTVHARIYAPPFYFFREKKRKKTKREILNGCANSVRFLDFPIERERERERDFGGVCLTERGDKNERNDDDG